MYAIRVALARLRALLRRNAIADEIREELQFHVEMRAQELARDGLDAREARTAALRRFGNPAVIHDRGYDERGGGLLETIVQDVQYGFRQLRRQPSFSIVAILTLALGIGVSTALFSVIDAALLRPLPYPHPEQLVTLSVRELRPGDSASMVAGSLNDIRIWRTVDKVVAHAGTGRVNGFVPLIVESGAPQRLVVGSASEDFLETYGVSPILGRSIQADDTRDGAPKVAVLGHDFWRREFGADPKVLGRVIRIQNEPVAIVGVLPSGFFPRTAVWQAEQFTPFAFKNRGSGEDVIARLRPGVTLAQASAALDAVTPEGRVFGPEPAKSHVVMTSMYDDQTGGYRVMIKTLTLAVGFILLIACVNVAGLTLARGATRDVELAIRASIGAGRPRLIRQLLTESLLLAVAGAAAGVLIAYASLDSLIALIPLSLPANSPVSINATVLAFSLGLTMVTAILFGLAPALKLSRAPRTITTTLAVGGRGGPLLSKRAGQWLMAIEVTLALVLMTGSGLLLRSFAKLLAVDLGFDPARVLTLEVEPLDQAASVRREYYDSLADVLRRAPEVAFAGAIDTLSLGAGGTYGFGTADTGVSVEGMQHTVLPGYFEAMGVRAISGRLFEPADRSPGDAIVANAAAARKYFNGDAVGHTVRTMATTPSVWRVVGVVPNILHGGPQWEARPELYILPDPRARDNERMTLAMVMRLRDGASLSLNRLKEMADRPGPRVLVGEARTAAALVSHEIEGSRHRVVLLTLLGTFGLALTLVGIFSMTAYAVVRRTREIGVRMALGARRSQVVGAMVRDAAWPVALGVAAGLAGAYYATRMIASFLFQTEPHDPGTLIAVVALLAGAAFCAAWLPARRAAAVDPLLALRAE
jgi:putative ABC transport system permease protein